MPDQKSPMGRAVRQARLSLRYGLVRAGRHVERARGQAALDRGLRLGCRTFACLAVLYLLWRLVVCFTGMTDPILGAWLFLGLALLVSLCPLPVLVFRAGGGREDLPDVAERLDLAAGNQNRIASALSLSAGKVGPFAAAALADGLEAVEAARDTLPVVPQRRLPGGLEIGAAYLGVVVLAGAGFLPVGLPGAGVPGSGAGDSPVHVARSPASLHASPGAPREAGRAPEEAAEVDPSEKPQAETARGKARSKPSPAGKRVKAAGLPGKGKSGEARQARQSSVSRGDPTEGDSPPTGATRKKPGVGKKKNRPPPKARVVGQRRKEGRQTGATAGQGGSGGGAMSPVKSPWAQRDRSSDEPLPENPADEDVEDEIEEEEARGGSQPSLRDRKAATSRDLSISGPGEGGEGRGGPTPHKKARGTASLVLGVPVLDFVRGLLNPGTTKVTRERVEPVTSPGKAHGAASAAGRTGLEPRIPGTRIPSSLREVVRRFLKSLHDPGRTVGSK